MLEVPSALRQGSAHEFVNMKLIMLSDVRGTIGMIRVKVDARGGAGGLWCHASGLHPEHGGDCRQRWPTVPTMRAWERMRRDRFGWRREADRSVLPDNFK
jgi:hypothetical protein